MESGNVALYQVAVALVPALLFGGATLELRSQGTGGSSRPRLPRRRAGLLVAAILAVGALAEVTAVCGAVDPAIPSFAQRFVALVITTGTVGLAIWIAAPLLREALADTRFQLGWKWALGVIVLTGLVGQYAISTSIEHAGERATLETASDRLTKAGREMSASEREELTARTQLIVLARSSPRAGVVTPTVLSHLHRLDQWGIYPVMDHGLRGEGFKPILDRSLQAMSIDEVDLVDDLEAGPGLEVGQLDLLTVAGQRVFQAAAWEMSARGEFAYATEDYERACGAARFLGCEPSPAAR